MNVERTLWFQSDDEHVKISDTMLSSRSEPLVILGEAGMGKSHLLQRLAENAGYSFCTARQLINRPNPSTLMGDAKVLVIDALDEINGQRDGDSVDLVLRKLGELNYPRFVLSCRVADWRSATGLDAIREQYSDDPIELHIEPFNDIDAINFLTTLLGATKSKEVIKHFNSRGLQGLLGNPQTLDLISRVANSKSLPETKGELFENAIELLRVEHQNSKAAEQPGCQPALAAAGAAFAGLILSGSAVIVRGAAASHLEGEIQLSDLRTMLDGQDIEKVIGSRLFRSLGADRFSYWHRRIGEYLGARWLSKLATTNRTKARLLHLFHCYGVVPSSLRGIHAWLAMDPALAPAVIAADPMGVIEYGDTDLFTIDQSRLLLEALKKLAAENPRFLISEPYRLRAITKIALLDDVRQLIEAPNTPFGLRLLVLQSVAGSPIAPLLASTLRGIVLDPQSVFANRSLAGDALTQIEDDLNWQCIFRTLCTYGDQFSVRLAIELTAKVGYEKLDSDLLVDLVVTHAVSESRVNGVLNNIEKNLPDSRLDGVLDRLAEVAIATGNRHRRPGNNVLTKFAYRLISRRVNCEFINAQKFWTWLSPFSEDYCQDRPTREKLTVALQQNSVLRRSIQNLVILNSANDRAPRQQSWRLCESSSGFEPTPEDVISLLGQLDPSDRDDARWREIVGLTAHDEVRGADVRAAAIPFAVRSNDFLKWLADLAIVRETEWQIKQQEYEQMRCTTRCNEKAKDRGVFAAKIEDLRMGVTEALIDPAQIYLGLFDCNDNDGWLPHERLLEWLGEEITEAIFAGFEVFLKQEPLLPTADDIVKGMVEGRLWYVSFVIVAALAERDRSGIGFSDISDERMLSGLFELRRSKIHDSAGIEELENKVATEVKARGGWINAMRRYHEPQLEARKEQVDGLHELMWNDEQISLSEMLAAEWLERFGELPAPPEIILIGRLLCSGLYDVLREVASSRLWLENVERRRAWQAVALIVDFEAASTQLDASTFDRELLFHLRDRIQGPSREHGGISLGIPQLEWLVASFRNLWPMAHRSMDIRTTNFSAQDASEFIAQLIRRIGNTSAAESTAALFRLWHAPTDGYTETIQAVAAEQTRIRVESLYRPPSLNGIDAITRNAPPHLATDLQAFMLEELAIVQAKVKSDDVDSWRGFYDDQGVPFAEERCRDHLLGLLRQGSDGIVLDPEAHIASDKEVDIACSVSGLRMPIEVKGQWHRDLWHAVDTQLDHLYTRDWRAEGRGIYLVLWFGPQKSRKKKLSSRGRGLVAPETPHQLWEILTRSSHATRDGRVTVFVLDMTRT